MFHRVRMDKTRLKLNAAAPGRKYSGVVLTICNFWYQRKKNKDSLSDTDVS
jgi:hypothetical protein